jgi:hypothetical protein
MLGNAAADKHHYSCECRQCAHQGVPIPQRLLLDTTLNRTVLD